MQTLYRVTCIPTLTVWCVLTFSEKYKKEKWQKPWDGKISWQKWLPRPRMELIQETFQSWKLRKHWHEFLLKDAFGAFISQYFAVYLRYKADPSVLFSLAFWSQSRSVCSEVLKWAWLDWSITGFWEHRVKVTRKYSVFCQNQTWSEVSVGVIWLGWNFSWNFQNLQSCLPWSSGQYQVDEVTEVHEGPEKLIQRLKCCTAHRVAVVWITQSFQEVHGNALG